MWRSGTLYGALSFLGRVCSLSTPLVSWHCTSCLGVWCWIFVGQGGLRTNIYFGLWWSWLPASPMLDSILSDDLVGAWLSDPAQTNLMVQPRRAHRSAPAGIGVAPLDRIASFVHPVLAFQFINLFQTHQSRHIPAAPVPFRGDSAVVFEFLKGFAQLLIN